MQLVGSQEEISILKLKNLKNKLNKIKIKNMKKCRFCNSLITGDGNFSLKNMPLGVQYFPKKEDIKDDKSVNIDLFECKTCGLIQAHSDQVVYETENSAATSISKVMMEHKSNQAKNFVKKYNLEGKKIFEAGCGDGHFLKHLQSAGAGLVVGVEPSLKSKETSEYKDNVKIYSNYITSDFNIAEGPFDAFATFHVMEHIPDLHDFVNGISLNLKEDGVGLVEVPSSEMIFDDHRFYDIINDHLNYFTLRTLSIIFEYHNFDILEQYRDWNGEHDVIVVRKRKKYNFSELVKYQNSSIQNLQNTLNEFNDKSVAIWGASMHALTILSQFQTNKIALLIDSANYKQSRVSPVSHYDIISPANISSYNLESIIIIAPRFVNEIVEILKINQDFKGSIYSLEKNSIIKIR